MWILVWLGCVASPDPVDVGHRLDDVLTFADVVALGTHNSFHVKTDELTLKEWDYDHLPLDQQLGGLGVRQFELDVWFNVAHGRFEVFHIPVVDEATTCRWLSECLATMAIWSASFPAHHPLFTLLEMKDAAGEDVDGRLAALEAEVEAAFGDALIRPSEVQREEDSLVAGLAANGWPTLGELRGRALFVMHDTGAWRDAYVASGTATLALFPDAGNDVAAPWAAVHTMNDPVADASVIAEAVALGHLVRTRADTDGEEARINDLGPAGAALTSGAHFVSTDFPAPHPDTGYVVKIQGGTPSACNLAYAPIDCRSEDIEDPEILSATASLLR